MTRLTDEDFAYLFRKLYAKAETSPSWWGDWTDLPDKWSTDDRVTFGMWRDAIQEWIDELDPSVVGLKR